MGLTLRAPMMKPAKGFVETKLLGWAPFFHGGINRSSHLEGSQPSSRDRTQSVPTAFRRMEHWTLPVTWRGCSATLPVT